jgi:2-polyprenyl-3-methyl-5-hydroxy-6-metoxy-1,4-benzoquinol methylase
MLWGTSRMKQEMWDREFGNGRWDHIESTKGDCVYRFVEKMARGGRILDLGCGSGNTGVELRRDAYKEYVGVDISKVAIDKAEARAKGDGRVNHVYYQSDILDYRPDRKFDVILFRESLCYVPMGKVKRTIDHFLGSLTEDGTIIVRLCDRAGYSKYVDLVRSNYRIIEEFEEPGSKTIIQVFQARQ